MQSVDPTLLALQTAKTAAQNAKKKVLPSLSTQAIAKPSLNVQTQQPQAIFTPPTAKVGGISSPFGAPNINSAPILWWATPTEIKETATQLQSLPKTMPKTGTTQPDMTQSLKDLKATIPSMQSIDDIKGAFPEFAGIEDSVLLDLVETTKNSDNYEDILWVFPELQWWWQKSNKVMDFLSQAAQPFKTVGEWLAWLATKAWEYLDPDTRNPVLQAVNTARMWAWLVDWTIKPRSEAENRYMDKSVSQNVLDTAEWTTYLASQIYAPITSAVFQAWAEIPWVKNVVWALWEWLSRVWEKLKYIPWYNQYRESLPPEDQQRLDWLAGNMIAAFVGSKWKGKITKWDLQGYLTDNFSDFASLDKSFWQSIVKGTKATIAGTKSLYNKIPNPIESIARKVTWTIDDQWKLFKAQEPRTNQLNKSVDYKNLRANSDIANAEIVKAWYKPTDTASRADAHANTMKKIRKEEIESKIGTEYQVDLNPVADAIDDFIAKQKTAWLVKNETQLRELKAQADSFRKRWSVDWADGEFTKEMMNAQINNRWDSSIWDIYKNWLKEASRVLWQSLDDTFSAIPWQFSEAKRRFWALKATYQDVVKADIKAQKAKWLWLWETFGRIDWIGDILWAVWWLFTGKNPLPQLASWFGKLAVWKVLAKIKDKDFLIQEWFEWLAKKAKPSQVMNITKKKTQPWSPYIPKVWPKITPVSPQGKVQQTPTPPKLTPKTPPITVEKGAIGMWTKATVLPPKPTVAPSVWEVKNISKQTILEEMKWYKTVDDYLEYIRKALDDW